LQQWLYTWMQHTVIWPSFCKWKRQKLLFEFLNGTQYSRTKNCGTQYTRPKTGGTQYAMGGGGVTLTIVRSYSFKESMITHVHQLMQRLWTFRSNEILCVYISSKVWMWHNINGMKWSWSLLYIKNWCFTVLCQWLAMTSILALVIAAIGQYG